MRPTQLRVALAATILCSAAATHAGLIVGSGLPTTSTLGVSTGTNLVPAPQGEGHILIGPYFNAQSGNASLFSVTNADFDNGKMVKIRLRGGLNGDNLLSWLVALGAGDVFTFMVTEGPDGIAQIVTQDTSCTMPRMAPGVPQPMLTGRLDPALTAAEKARQTREGYVEIQNVADIPAKRLQAAGTTPLVDNPLYAVIASTTGTPPPCGTAFESAVQTDHVAEPAAAQAGFATPTGGLMGKWSILNVPRTTTYSGALHALRAVDNGGQNARANFVLFPQSAVRPVTTLQLTSDPILRDVAYLGKTKPGVTSAPTQGTTASPGFHDFPDLSTPYVTGLGNEGPQRQAQILTATMLAKSVKNDYALDASVGARTDWVFSMPARRYSVAVDYTAEGSAKRRFSMVPHVGPQFFHDENTVLGVRPGTLCVPSIATVVADRSGRSHNYDIVLTGTFQMQLCAAVAVQRWGRAQSNPSFVPNDAVGPLGDSALRSDGPSNAYENGWARFTPSAVESPLGLPLLGTSFVQAFNPAATPGVSGTYGITSEHVLGR